jgi:formylmethanofuran dehydrogenase subunit C
LILAQCKDLGPTYLDCGAHHLTYIGLLGRSLESASANAARLLSRKLRRYGGDTSVYGKGEILTPLRG